MKLNLILVYHPEQVSSIFHHRGCSILQLNSAEPRGAVDASRRRYYGRSFTPLGKAFRVSGRPRRWGKRRGATVW